FTTRMDSEDFQRRIEEQIRNNDGSGGIEIKERNEKVEETGEEKGKGLEKRKEGVDRGENAELDRDIPIDEEVEIQGSVRTAKNSKPKAHPTRQSKRKNGQPPELESQLVGPVRIKKPKGKGVDIPTEVLPASTNNGQPSTVH
ncbi:hypothetical protein DFH28DRAFT_871893, partial [Melampsora americana]